MKNAFEVLRDTICESLWKTRLDIVKKWQEEIREDQRKKCSEAFVEELNHISFNGMRKAILNAGKSPEGEKEKEPTDDLYDSDFGRITGSQRKQRRFWG